MGLLLRVAIWNEIPGLLHPSGKTEVVYVSSVLKTVTEGVEAALADHEGLQALFATES